MKHDSNDEQTVDGTPELTTALGRSALYTFLSRALAYPTPANRADLDDIVAPLALAIETGDEDVDRLVREVADALTVSVEELRSAHSRVFTHVEPPDYPPYETAFDRADAFRQSAVMADVAGFYRAHGLQVGGEERERPDHVVTELEFMGFMARKEAYALENLGDDEVQECRRTQVAFLRDHLGRWAPAFGQRLGLFCDEPVFQVTGSLLERWIEAEIEAWGAEPTDRLETPQPLPEPDDGSCGFDETTCPVVNTTDMPMEIGRKP